MPRLEQRKAPVARSQGGTQNQSSGPDVNTSKTKASSAKLIRVDFSGAAQAFNDNGWFNATRAAEMYGKRVDNWLRLDETKEYIAALFEASNPSLLRDLGAEASGGAGILNPSKKWYLKTRRGNNGGTWLHPDLAVVFARWLDVRFGVWCDQQIKAILAGSHPYFDWERVRHRASVTHSVLADAVLHYREGQGKACESKHYINEARLIAFVLLGHYGEFDRNALAKPELDLLAKLETKDAGYLLQGLEYQERKARLLAVAEAHKAALAPPAQEVAHVGD